MNTIVILLMLVLLPVFVLTMFIPYWTRKTESFGVSIPEEIYSSPQLIDLRKKYVFQTGLLSLITLAAVVGVELVYALDETGIGIMVSIVTTVYLAASFLIYYRFHRLMKKLKAASKWNEGKSQQIFVNMKFRTEKLTYSNLWFIIPLLITLATALFIVVNYNAIPSRIPMQYGLDGTVTSYAEKSPRSAMFPPVMQLGMTLLFIFINTIISRSKQQINADNPEASLQRNIIFRRRWSAYTIVSGIALISLFAFMAVTFVHPVPSQVQMIVTMGVTTIMVLGAIILSVTTGQGGSRIKIPGESTRAEVTDRDDDKHWKLGIFYFNRNDPALFMEKRFGIGWTINYARPLAWILFLGILLLAIGIPYLLVP